MEGTYFFGEHLRWNLGWSNPNQAGVFVAMWIPWLWALWAWAAGTRNEEGAGSSWQGLRRDAASPLVLAAEMVLWFLLCKTYSRGALVAVGFSGVVFILWRWWSGGRSFKRIGLLGCRLAVIGGLLLATGFFSRIDPRFVSQDASAGNRLVLWKGGLQMIAVSPWQGWGAGKSGSGFMHWFQPLDANEQYAGMVNSYLHVGVEYGLPVLVAVMTAAVGLCLLAWRSVGARDSGHCMPRDAAAAFMMGAGCSWLVFLVANVFSTLWIFRDLWWLPGFSGLWIIVGGGIMLGRGFLKTPGGALGAAISVSMLVALGSWAVGKSIAGNVRIARSGDGKSVFCFAEGSGEKSLWFFPDNSVLGENWGKEIRRLVASPGGMQYEVVAPTPDLSTSGGIPPAVIVACGSEFPAGFTAAAGLQDCELVLVHPLGQPVIPVGFTGKVRVILPMLDTGRSGKAWRASCKKKAWPCLTSPGVGQDVRLLWPEILTTNLKQE